MSAGTVIYTGQELSLVGDKGRFVLPADFRRAVTEDSGNENIFFAWLHPTYNCLTGFGSRYMAKLNALATTRQEAAFLSGESFDDDPINILFGNATKIAFDNSGRFIMPVHMREMVGITDAIYFHGARDTFLMWSPDVLEREDDRKWLSAKASCRSLLATSSKGRK